MIDVNERKKKIKTEVDKHVVPGSGSKEMYGNLTNNVLKIKMIYKI